MFREQGKRFVAPLTLHIFTTKQAQLRLALNCFIAQTIKANSLDSNVVKSYFRFFFCSLTSFSFSKRMRSKGWCGKFATLPENLITKRVMRGRFCAIYLEALFSFLRSRELHVKFSILNYIRFSIWFPALYARSRNILEVIPKIWNILAHRKMSFVFPRGVWAASAVISLSV